MQKQFTRTEILLGTEQITNLKNKHVLIAGVGGVGGYALEAVLRAGVGKITIIDNDVVDITNINRQLISTLDVVGQAKTEVYYQRAQLINPECNIIAKQIFIDENNIPELLSDKPDFIIDCIDTMNSKVALLEYAIKNKFKIVSSMGAGNRIDVSKAKLADISQTSVCALAKTIRLRLRKCGIKKGLTVVFSDELPYNKPQVQEIGRPINGTISYLPALFGIMLSGYVIKKLIETT